MVRDDPASGAQRVQRVDRFGIAFLLLAMVIGLGILGPVGTVTSALSILLGAGALVFCMEAAGVGRRAALFARALAGLAAMAAFGIVIGGDAPFARNVHSGIWLGLAVLLPVPIARRLIAHPEVTLNTIAGAMCLYLLAGIAFADLYEIADSAAGPAFAQLAVANHSEALYFSFVTIAAVGYGDLTPASPPVRLLAVVEGVGGQLYLVTVLALLVGNLGRPRNPRG